MIAMPRFRFRPGRLPTVLLLACLLWSGGAQADYNQALAAYKAGDYDSALREWTPLAEQGDPSSQASLAVMYYQGAGVARDYAKAAYWMRKSADQGGAAAQVFLGTMYFDGKGMPKDDRQAVVWYRRAAGQGSTQAQNLLGMMYYRGGVGIERSPTIAIAWFRQAADKGDAAAEYNLGVCYEQGEGVAPDLAQALDRYRQAAAQGYAPALADLGHRYLDGRTLTKNPLLAYVYLDIALRQVGDPATDPASEALLEQAEAQLTPDRLEQAQQMSAGWAVGKPLPDH
jgi:uncharacterized protein